MSTILTDHVKITNPTQLKAILESINHEIEKGNLETLYQRGVFDDVWDDFVEGIYFNTLDKRIYRLTCETHHGSGGEWTELVVNWDELAVVYEELQRYTFWNWQSKLFVLSSFRKKDGISYFFNAQEVSDYFNQGAEYLNSLYDNLQKSLKEERLSSSLLPTNRLTKK